MPRRYQRRMSYDTTSYPNAVAASGSAMAGSIAYLGETVGEGIRQYRERQAQAREKEKEDQEIVRGFKMLWQSSPDLQEAMPVNDWGSVSANDVRGAMSGLKLMKDYMELQASQEQLQASRQSRAAGLADAEEEAMNEQALRNSIITGDPSAALNSYAMAGGTDLEQMKFLNTLNTQSREYATEETEREAINAALIGDPEGSIERYAAAGGGSVEALSPLRLHEEYAMEQANPFTPSIVDAGGVPAMMTSKKSAVPLLEKEGDPDIARRKLAVQAASLAGKDFGGKIGLPYTLRDYADETYNEDGSLKEGKQPDPVMEGALNTLNDMYEELYGFPVVDRQAYGKPSKPKRSSDEVEAFFGDL